jgi:multisubunit Na+/H+ antiporter MnhE subunit
MSRPPFRVTLLLALVLFIFVWNILRVWTALAWWDALNEFAAQPNSLLIIISGGVWVCASLFLMWAVLQRKIWSDKLLITLSIAYTLWYWFEKFVWGNPQRNWLFAVMINLVLFVFILFATKSLSREAYERKFENPTIE